MSTRANAVRLSDLLSGLSRGLDLGEGQPYGHAMRSCLIGMRLGESLRLNSETRSALYYALLLKDAGGSSTSAPLAELFQRDDPAVKRDLQTTDWTRRSVAEVVLHNAPAHQPPWTRLWRALRTAANGPRVIASAARIRAERGAAIVQRLGLPTASVQAIYALHEHWDDRGHPDGKRGDDIPLLARIALLAQTVDVIHVSEGLDATIRLVRRRRGTWFDPSLVDTLAAWRDDARWWTALRCDDLAAQVIAAEPGGRIHYLDEDGVDVVAGAFAEIIDAKTRFTHGNSTEIARRATGIARECGVGPAMQRRIYRAALLHDIGNLGVSARILTKPGPLTPDEHKAIERHTVYTWEILSRIGPLRDIASTAALHHERLDGNGYPNGLDHTRLDLPARILAVADVYVALINERPYRAALPPEVALALLRNEADDGGFDAGVVRALARSLHAAPSLSVPTA